MLRWLSIVDRYSKMYLNKNFQKLGINSSQHMFVKKICENEGITQDKLYPLFYINRSNITRALILLEKENFIRKEPSKKDKRTVRIYPTEKSKEIYQEIVDIEDAWMDILISKFTEDEKCEFLSLIKKMGETAVEALSENEEEE